MIEIVREQREEAMAFERIGATYKLPVTFVAIEEVLEICGQGHVAFPRPKDAKNCDGCSLRFLDCKSIQCSKPDRKDGISVFFRRVY